jgi:hypothetical protein
MLGNGKWTTRTRRTSLKRSGTVEGSPKTHLFCLQRFACKSRAHLSRHVLLSIRFGHVGKPFIWKTLDVAWLADDDCLPT